MDVMSRVDGYYLARTRVATRHVLDRLDWELTETQLRNAARSSCAAVLVLLDEIVSLRAHLVGLGAHGFAPVEPWLPWCGLCGEDERSAKHVAGL